VSDSVLVVALPTANRDRNGQEDGYRVRQITAKSTVQYRCNIVPSRAKRALVNLVPRTSASAGALLSQGRRLRPAPLAHPLERWQEAEQLRHTRMLGLLSHGGGTAGSDELLERGYH
jgi:hypothetical protein